MSMLILGASWVQEPAFECYHPQIEPLDKKQSSLSIEEELRRLRSYINQVIIYCLVGGLQSHAYHIISTNKLWSTVQVLHKDPAGFLWNFVGFSNNGGLILSHQLIRHITCIPFRVCVILRNPIICMYITEPFVQTQLVMSQCCMPDETSSLIRLSESHFCAVSSVCFGRYMTVPLFPIQDDSCSHQTVNTWRLSCLSLLVVFWILNIYIYMAVTHAKSQLASARNWKLLELTFQHLSMSDQRIGKLHSIDDYSFLGRIRSQKAELARALNYPWTGPYYFNKIIHD